MDNPVTDEQETVAPVSAQTLALSAYIQNTISQLRNRSPSADPQDEEPQSSLLFFGNWQDPYPRALVTDPILEPVDKVVWQIIRTHLSTPSAVTAFPSYRAIRAGANVKSNHTVSRAITILRATRWLSLCERVRDAQGRFVGNLYALHDEPITLADALHLDSDYIGFLRNSCNHKQLRVCRLAKNILSTIQDRIEAGKDATGKQVQTWTYERRISLFAQKQDTPPHQFYALSDAQIAALNQSAPDLNKTLRDSHECEVTADPRAHKTHKVKNDANSRVHKMHMDENCAYPPVHKMHKVVCSSSCINTTTTNKYKTKPRVRAKPCASLHFPPQISANERNLAMMYLESIADALQQDLLDEWQGRLHTGTKRGTPIENPIGYLAVLCQRAKAGTFQLTIGLRVREAREREKNQQRRLTESVKRNDDQTLTLLQQHSGGGTTRITQRLEEIRSGVKKRKAES